MEIRVLLIDGHAFVRERLASMLEEHEDILVVGQSDDVPAALPEPRPHVIILDSNDTERCREATAEVLRRVPDAALVATSLDATWDCVSGMLESGARGFVLKDRAFEELPQAVRLAAAGDVFISPNVQRPPDLFGAAEALAAEGPLAEMVCRLVELRDPLVARHQRRVAELCSALCEELAMCPHEATTIRHAALMHDVGKLGVPAEVLAKPSSLGASEVRIVRSHCEKGYLVLSAGKVAAPIPEIVYQHHERCDGSGYPRGLTADQMLFGAKVLAVADVMEAMLSARPYRAGKSVEVVLEEIESGAGVFYDEQVSRACARLFRTGGFKFANK